MSAAAPAVPSYASGTSDVPLLGDTIGDNFDRTVAARPDREALVDVPPAGGGPTAQLRDEVDALALGLLARGVAKGDRVGIWAPNCPGVDAGAVRHGEDRRDPGQHQSRPTARTSWSTC